MQLLHTEVLDKLHVLLAIALELPEDYFLKIHDVRASSTSIFMHMLTRRRAVFEEVGGPPALHEVLQVHARGEPKD
jgi:hypothetical protein